MRTPKRQCQPGEGRRLLWQLGLLFGVLSALYFTGGPCNLTLTC